MASYERITPEVLKQNPRLKHLFQKARIFPARGGGSFLKGFKSDYTLSQYGKFPDRGGMVVPQHEPEELEHIKNDLSWQMNDTCAQLEMLVRDVRAKYAPQLAQQLNTILHSRERNLYSIMLPTMEGDPFFCTKPTLKRLKQSLAFTLCGKTYHWTEESMAELQRDLKQLFH